MKKYLLLIPIFFIFACSSSESSDEANNVVITDTTSIDFEQVEFDFGTIDQGEQISTTFKFKNTGDYPLVISDVTTSCGCTVSSYSKKPVNPMSEGFLKITFNSAGKVGNQHKTITVYTNTKPETTQLVLVGNVNVSE